MPAHALKLIHAAQIMLEQQNRYLIVADSPCPTGIAAPKLIFSKDGFGIATINTATQQITDCMSISVKDAHAWCQKTATPFEAALAGIIKSVCFESPA